MCASQIYHTAVSQSEKRPRPDQTRVERDIYIQYMNKSVRSYLSRINHKRGEKQKKATRGWQHRVMRLIRYIWWFQKFSWTNKAWHWTIIVGCIPDLFFNQLNTRLSWQPLHCEQPCVDQSSDHTRLKQESDCCPSRDILCEAHFCSSCNLLFVAPMTMTHSLSLSLSCSRTVSSIRRH